MLGAIIGDIVGSVYEFGADKTKDFQLFSPGCSLTDDSLMTMAVGITCVSADTHNEGEFKRTLSSMMREIGRQYPYAGYGDRFFDWLTDDDAGPYGSGGNGSAMRVSPVAYAAESLEDAERLAKWSAEVTHNSTEGITGAQAVAAAVYLARTGHSKDEIRAYIDERYYNMNVALDEIRPGYKYSVLCEGSVPQAIICFLEAYSFEDALRNAVSLGGDGDTMAAIAGAIAEAYFGIPEEIAACAFRYFDDTEIDYYYDYADQLYPN